MTTTRIVMFSIGGVVTTAASFLAGYVTGKKAERKRVEQLQERPSQPRDEHRQEHGASAHRPS